MTATDTTPRYTYYGQQLTHTQIANLPDHLICKDTTDGALIVHQRTQRHVPVPSIPTQRTHGHQRPEDGVR